MSEIITGDFIRTLREKLRMSQEALAQKLHVSLYSITRWEKIGAKTIRMHEANKKILRDFLRSIR